MRELKKMFMYNSSGTTLVKLLVYRESLANLKRLIYVRAHAMYNGISMPSLLYTSIKKAKTVDTRKHHRYMYI